MSDRLTFGIDKGSPNGDKTALTIKRDDKLFSFVGEEAEAILAWHYAEVNKARREERTKNLPITKVKLSNYLGVSRPTLDGWIENPDRMTIGTVKKLLELEGDLAHLNTKANGGEDE